MISTLSGGGPRRAAARWSGLAAAILLGAHALAVAPPALADDGAVVVMPPVVHSAPLFADELGSLQEAVQHFLVGNGYEMAPQRVLEAAMSLSAAGRATAKGPVCAVPPSVSELLADDPAIESRARVEVGWLCNPGPGGCRWADTLRVVLLGPGADTDAEPLRYWRADVTDHTPAGWAAAAANLVSSTPPTSPSAVAPARKLQPGLRITSRVTFEAGKEPAGRGGGTPSALNSLDSVFTVGAGSTAPAPDQAARDKQEAAERKATARAEKAEAKALAKCFRPTMRTAGSAVLAVDAGGSVTRCEARHDGWLAAGDDFDTCLCRRLSGRRYPEGASDRRVVVEVSNTRREPKKAKNAAGEALVASAKVESLEAEPGFRGEALVRAVADRLAYCASPRGVPAKVEVMWRVRANGAAGVPLVAVDGPSPDGTRRCVERQLADVAFPCTDTNRSARVLLRVTLDRVKEPARAASTPF